MVRHRRTPPFRLAFLSPHHTGFGDTAAVAVDIGPDLDILADDTLDRRAAAVDGRRDLFKMEGAARDALDNLS